MQEHVSRRSVLRGIAGATAAAGAASLGAGTVAAGGGLSSWFSNTSNYDGVVDETGKSEVTVKVGAQGNGGGFAFGPAAIRVDPGTKVVWEWTGTGGSHNVVAKDGSFESDLLGKKGATFTQTFESVGVTKYYCMPHKAMGMKGAVVVGDVQVGGSGGSKSAASQSSPDFGGWFENVSNFDGVVDETGKSEVTVKVGAQGNGGGFAFAPAAVRVSPGATVTWKWTGKGGKHNVVAKDGSFESDLLGTKGATFTQTFESVGVTKYYCMPHKAMGMKGAVVVDGDAKAVSASSGDANPGGVAVTGGELAIVGSVLAAFLSPLAFGAFLGVAEDEDAGHRPE